MDQPPRPRITRPVTADARQAENRRRLREFLRAIPRAEPESRLELLGPVDGQPGRVVTRAELTAAIEQMRPLMRQIILLTLEEHYEREAVQDYLRISLRTLERQQAAGLDLLAALGQTSG
jgi:hypothetical protein